jgi:hypothetical protein
MLQAVGFDILGIGKFAKKAVRKTGKVLRPITKPIGKVLRNPVVQVLNPGAAIAVHTTSKAVGGRGTIKGAAGRLVDAGAGIAAGRAKVPFPKVNLAGAVKAIGAPKLPAPALPYGRSTGTALAKTFTPRDPAGILSLKRRGATRISVGPAGMVKASVRAVAAAATAVGKGTKPKAAALALTAAKRPSTASIASVKARYPLANAITKKNVAVKSSRPAPSIKLLAAGAGAGVAAASAVAPKPATTAASITQDGFFIPRTGADAGRVLRTGRNAGRVAR